MNREIPEDIRSDLAAEARYKRRMEERFNSGLNCRDPSHYGCPNCEPEEFGDWEDYE